MVVCVCVGVWDREREREHVYVCVLENERKKVCVCARARGWYTLQRSDDVPAPTEEDLRETKTERETRNKDSVGVYVCV